MPLRALIVRLCALAAVLALVPAGAAGASVRRWSENVSVGNADSSSPDINGLGDAVAYVSRQTNGVLGAPGTPQVLVRQLPRGRAELASVSNSGQPAANPYALVGIPDPFQGGGTIDPTRSLVSGPSMSIKGTAVAFTSTATNLVPADTNNIADVFVHDRVPGKTELVSVGLGGHAGNGPSWGASFGYGERYVAFVSRASNLVRGDHNGHADAFLRDMVRHRTYLISHSRGCGGINADVTDVTVTDGSYVGFSTAASNVVPHDTNGVSDVFLRRVFGGRCGHTTRESVTSRGHQANGPSSGITISNYGKAVAFVSSATNLVAHDTNGVQDVFWRLRADSVSSLPHMRGPRTLRASVAHLTGAQANGPSYDPVITSAGRSVYFDSAASNLYRSDSDHRRDIYHHDFKSRYTPLTSDAATGGIGLSISYHGSQVVYTAPTLRGSVVPFVSLPQLGRSAAAQVPSLLDVLHVSLDHESAPPPPGFL